MSTPSVEQLLEIIDGLLTGNRTRAEVASWANQLFADDNIRHTKVIARALESLGAADLVGVDRPFLYDEKDFQKWRDELTE